MSGVSVDGAVVGGVRDAGLGETGGAGHMEEVEAVGSGCENGGSMSVYDAGDGTGAPPHCHCLGEGVVLGYGDAYGGDYDGTSALPSAVPRQWDSAGPGTSHSASPASSWSVIHCSCQRYVPFFSHSVPFSCLADRVS